jgi:hypothetical protein
VSLPQANATLTRVAGGGYAEDYDRAAGADSEKWAGSAEAYYQERRERVAAAGETTLILRRSLIVANDVASFSEGDVVSFTFDGSSRTGNVQVIERREYAPAGELQTTRLTLEET